MAIRPWATTMAYVKPEQAALTSNAPQRRPRPSCTVADVAGTVRSGVVVARTRASIWCGSRPAISIARRPASIDSDAVLPPTRRSWMPVRSTIHSSVVSRPLVRRSSLVSTLSGRAVPHPVMTPPRADPGVDGMTLSVRARTRVRAGAQPGDGLAGHQPLGVDGDVALQHAGERRAHLVLADVAEHGADLDGGAVGDAGGAGEHAGGRADHHPLAGEEVLALDRERTASARRCAGTR